MNYARFVAILYLIVSRALSKIESISEVYLFSLTDKYRLTRVTIVIL